MFKKKIQKRLEKFKSFNYNDSFIKFLEQSIIHRENSKFYFTKSIELIFVKLKKSDESLIFQKMIFVILI